MSADDSRPQSTELLGRVRSVLHSRRVRKWSSLVEIQPQGSRRPIFGVHPMNGEVYFYHKLVPLLGLDQPIYGLRARGMDGREPPLTRIEDMAAAYLQEVVQVQPHGPYLIVGRCVGSRIAFEMAQQLVRRGETVDLLCLIDPGPLPVAYSWPAHLANLGRYVRYHASRGNLITATYRSALPRLRRARALVTHRRERVEVGRLRQKTVHQATRAALWRELVSPRHRETHYPGRVLVLVADDALRHVDTEESWRRVAALDVRRVPGDHIIMVADHLPTIAQHLREAIDTVSEPAPQ